jgi:DNA invertase Pin-like site-specific DNA recombinase
VRQRGASGCEKIFRVVASGGGERSQLRRALSRLDADDVSMVTRLDRLARPRRDLLNTLGAIADRKASIRSLADACSDATTPHGRLVLAVLTGLAEFERDLRER